MKYMRLRTNPVLPLGENKTLVTGCKRHLDLSRSAAAEGTVLLKNEKGALPLKNGERLALFGISCVEPLVFGGGSGEVTTDCIYNLYTGLEKAENNNEIFIFAPLRDFYLSYLKQEKIRIEKEIQKGWKLAEHEKDAFREASEYAHVNAMQYAEADLPESLIEEAAQNAETAIIAIRRYSFEGHDRRPIKGDYYLSDTEEKLIDRVTKRFKKTVLILNICSAVDCELFAENDKIGAVLCNWLPGSEGFAATADILLGHTNPSGKLADTFARDYGFYPCSASRKKSYEYDEYFEDIYVGYRYFETLPDMQSKVRYPFGYGLSYTTFKTRATNAYVIDDEIFVDVEVKNIGAVSGKEVVGIYAAAPQGVLGKPSRVLVGFKKTAILNPGEKTNFVISFNKNDLASFDDLGKIQKSAYILEKGEYNFYIGINVRTAQKLDFAYFVKEDTVVEQLAGLCGPRLLEKRLLANGEYEALPKCDKPYAQPQNKPVSVQKPKETLLFDDVESEAELDAFISQLSDSDLAELTSGQPLGYTTAGNISYAGAFPGNKEFCIPPMPTIDGPAGLHVNDIPLTATAWPCATGLACTFNVDLLEQIGIAAGKEVKENNNAVWLAPALNIHRDPLCGRNFEYFSEDPLVSGKMAAAITKGVQSQKTAVSVKHFACNNMEFTRFTCDSRVSERALREIYLKGFEICVKQANPWTVMSSYNLLNGIHTSESYELLTLILRGEWGFKGLVTSDWDCKNNPVNEVKAGNDVKMSRGYPSELLEALKSGALTRADLETAVKHTLAVYLRFE